MSKNHDGLVQDFNDSTRYWRERAHRVRQLHDLVLGDETIVRMLVPSGMPFARDYHLVPVSVRCDGAMTMVAWKWHTEDTEPMGETTFDDEGHLVARTHTGWKRSGYIVGGQSRLDSELAQLQDQLALPAGEAERAGGRALAGAGM